MDLYFRLFNKDSLKQIMRKKVGTEKVVNVGKHKNGVSSAYWDAWGREVKFN